jgi:hypothetical protein
MIDIVRIEDGEDLGLFNTDVERAKNILSVQVGALTYAPTLGIDLKYFLSEDYVFENESFRSYLVQVLANFSINVTSVLTVVESLSENLTFNIGASQETGGGMVAR